MQTVVDRQVLTDLVASKQRWARLPVRDKIGYLEEVRRLTVRHAADWAEAGARLKGFPADSPLGVMEEWLQGPMGLASYLTDLITSLTALERGDDLLAGIRLRTRPDGQVIARVLPRDVYDLLFQTRADVWMQPGVTIEGLKASLAPFYQQADPPGRVTLVLGAGNVALLTALDILSALAVDGDVVVVKMNPVNEVYGPVMEQMFAPLIADGYVRFVYGGADVGAALVDDALVERVHMTGGAHTYDAIMWGTGPEADERRRRGEPLLDKPFTAELGGVGPTIVVPGQWSRADIDLQAQVVATQKLNYSGHVCAASQVLVLPESWPQAEQFLAAVRAALAAAPHRESFYPGTQDKIDAFMTTHPDAELLPCRQPRVLLTGLHPGADHPVFGTELFAPIYATTSLPGDTPQEFLAHAIDFANDRLTGNLSANLIIDPATAKHLGPGLEDAVADLRAGSIGINMWSVFACVVGRCPWGAYPGNDPTDIQSGIGVVHNALMFPRPQKNVLWAGFRPTPPLTRRGQYPRALKPFWLVDNELTLANAHAFVDFYANPSPRTLLAVLGSMVLPQRKTATRH
jgi:aldehyde dehydrogenase (NAD(P)+)